MGIRHQYAGECIDYRGQLTIDRGQEPGICGERITMGRRPGALISIRGSFEIINRYTVLRNEGMEPLYFLSCSNRYVSFENRY